MVIVCGEVLTRKRNEGAWELVLDDGDRGVSVTRISARCPLQMCAPNGMQVKLGKKGKQLLSFSYPRSLSLMPQFKNPRKGSHWPNPMVLGVKTMEQHGSPIGWSWGRRSHVDGGAASRTGRGGEERPKYSRLLLRFSAPSFPHLQSGNNSASCHKGLR